LKQIFFGALLHFSVCHVVDMTYCQGQTCPCLYIVQPCCSSSSSCFLQSIFYLCCLCYTAQSQRFSDQRSVDHLEEEWRRLSVMVLQVHRQTPMPFHRRRRLSEFLSTLVLCQHCIRLNLCALELTLLFPLAYMLDLIIVITEIFVSSVASLNSATVS